MAGSQSLQAHDGIPREILRIEAFADMFEMYLPGWAVNGEYNYRISASTQKGTIQLQQIMHSGQHPWINAAFR